MATVRNKNDQRQLKSITFVSKVDYNITTEDSEDVVLAIAGMRFSKEKWDGLDYKSNPIPIDYSKPNKEYYFKLVGTPESLFEAEQILGSNIVNKEYLKDRNDDDEN